ncbi:MAG TPA: hypothetical protein DEP85_00665 [Holosporales bacterium]|nr:hypothetical protein [Holosporales bacterium]
MVHSGAPARWGATPKLNRISAPKFLLIVGFDFVFDGEEQIEVQNDVDNGDEEDGPEEQSLNPFSDVEIGKRAKEGGKEERSGFILGHEGGEDEEVNKSFEKGVKPFWVSSRTW